MRISEEHYYKLVDRVVQEGDPQLSIGPLAAPLDDVPAEWVPILTSADPRTAIAHLWRSVAHRLPRTYLALRERLHAVALLRTEETPASLVYLFTDGTEWVPYRGRPAVAEAALKRSRLPDDFLEFYRIHDGWVLYYSEDGGPVPSTEWLPISRFWTEVVWKLPPGDISEESAIAVYRDGDELAFAYETAMTPAAPLGCFGDGSVDVLLDMWAAIDRELGGFLAEMDLAIEPDSRAGRSGNDRSGGIQAGYERVVAQLADRQALAAHLGGGSAHEQASELLLQCARFERQGSGRRDTIVSYYRQALDCRCTSIGLGNEVSADELLDWFGLAHALGDTGTAHFIASVPTSLWADDTPDALQARTLFCLFLWDLEHATAFAEELAAALVESETAVPDDDITLGLLQALVRKDARAYAEERQRAVDSLCKADERSHRVFPWSLRLRGFDAVAVRLGIYTQSN